MIRRAIPPATALAAALALAAAVAPNAEAPKPAAGAGIRFTDVTEAAGIRFRHENGAAGGKLLPETMGSGAAWLDFDGDGRLDLLLVNGRAWKPDGAKTTAALYRNRGPGPSGEVTFEDATRGSGLDVELYGFGAAVADYDGDGRPDVYLTALEGDRLFKNLGGGRFADVTEAAGIDNRGFGTSAAWLDYDLDGRADLFVANYVTWSRETDQRCSLDGKTRSYCTPEVYPGSAGKLWRNLGPDREGPDRDGPDRVGTVRFEDAGEKAGVSDPGAKALAVAVLDVDGDRRPDLFVANDTEPNQLFRNRGPGKDGTVTFEDVALEAGVAYSETGTARGAMGTDAADYDRSGRPHLVVANFANEMAALYRNLGPGGNGSVRFEDRGPASPVGRATLPTLAFGAFFFDYDLDGWLDVLLANGHIDDGVERVQPGIAFRQPPQLFRNVGSSGDQTARFDDVSDRVGPDFQEPLLARGAAYGDYDGDGDLDVVITQNGGPARLFRNDGGERNRWVRVRLSGRRSTPDGLGAVVRVTSASGTQWRAVASGSSYCSESERTLTFGLGRDREVEALEVEWPSGERQRFEGIAANREVTVEEGKGIVE